MKLKIKLVIGLFFYIGTCSAQNVEQVPGPVKLLLKSYPESIVRYHENKLYFKDGTFLVYDDGDHNKTHQALLDAPSIKDQFHYAYEKGLVPTAIPVNHDPGRIRNEAFFKKMYGATKAEVNTHLTEIIWCPKTVGQKIRVTKINGVDKALKRISEELDRHPELSKYVKNSGGTFNWRYISGTHRLSGHSFGMSIDINVKFSNYWQWDSKSTDESATISYKNSIPQLIVDIFENNGFIWGGKWYHYDTMHFEYRPELL